MDWSLAKYYVSLNLRFGFCAKYNFYFTHKYFRKFYISNKIFLFEKKITCNLARQGVSTIFIDSEDFFRFLRLVLGTKKNFGRVWRNFINCMLLKINDTEWVTVLNFRCSVLFLIMFWTSQQESAGNRNTLFLMKWWFESHAHTQSV